MVSEDKEIEKFKSIMVDLKVSLRLWNDFWGKGQDAM